MAITLTQTRTAIKNAASLGEAKDAILLAAREAQEAGRHDKITVELDGGQYTLEEPLVLSATENPELLHLDITLRGRVPRAATVQSFGHVFGKDLTPVEGKSGAYTYRFPKGEDGKYPLFRELLFNGHLPMKNAESPVWRNRIPLTDEEREGKVKRDGLYVPIEIAKALKEGGIGSTEILMCIEWEYAILHVADVHLDKTQELGGKTHALVTLWDGEIDFLCEKCIKILNIGGRNTYFRNSPAFLSEPYSYAYDYQNGILHILLPADVSPSTFAVEYGNLETLISVEGLSNFTLENLVFSGVTSKYACENPIMAGQANSVRGVGRLRHAAVLAENTRHFTVKNCYFHSVGGNGVQSVNNSTALTVQDCVFKNIGMCGITVGNPSYNWDDFKNHTFATRIENNHFEHIGYAFPAAPCIYSGMVDSIKILHNTIKDCAYSAMSVGWGWSPAPYELGEKFNIRDAEIAYNYIEDFMQILRDGGAIYVLGGNANKDTTPARFNRMHDNFAILSVPTRSGDDGKYGYYCDGASSNWDVSDSVVIGVAGMPIYSQHHPSALSFHNHFRNIYSTTPPGYSHTHVPERDVAIIDYHLVEEGKDALLEKYPEARKIRDAAGAKNLF